MANLRKFVVSVFMVFVSSLSVAAWTPTTDFADNGDGTVTHKPTGLTWMRCAMGQTWAGDTCSGDGSFYSWEKAAALTSNFAGKSDWRLPTPWELASIVDFDASNPAANTAIFPNTAIAHYAIYSQCLPFNPCPLIPVAYYWTGLPSKTATPSYYWYVDFVNGAINSGYHDVSLANRYDYYFVRMVRDGNSLGGTTTPSADFTDNGDGTATHGKTNLIWMRCAMGQIWASGGCSGTVNNYDRSQASALSADFAGYGDWRLPSILELVSIVEYGAGNPAINAAIFPATPSVIFWSGSAVAGGSNSVYGVNFSSGSTVKDSNGSYAARLVRGGKAAGNATALPAATSDCIFNWVEKAYPQYFPPPGGTSASHASYYYRYYPATGNYLATSSADGHVWVLGPVSGDKPLDMGSAVNFLGALGCSLQ